MDGQNHRAFGEFHNRRYMSQTTIYSEIMARKIGQYNMKKGRNQALQRVLDGLTRILLAQSDFTALLL